MVHLSHPFMNTGKTIALTRWTFVDKVMSLLFKILSRFVIAFLPKSKHLLILWLQWQSIVILEPKKIKVCHCFHFFHIYLPWSDRTSWRRKWQPTPVFLSGESHGQRSLVSHSPWGHKETDMTEATQHACTQDGTVRHELSFWMLSFKPAFSLFSFTFIKRLFSSSSLYTVRVVSSAYLRLLIILLATLIPAVLSHDVLCIKVK